MQESTVKICGQGGGAVCNICKKAFSNTDDLFEHLTIHAGKTSFYCSLCGKSFLNPFVYRNHMYKHAGLKPLKVDPKQYYCSPPSGLSKFHRRNSKIFECNTCKKRFKFKSMLTNHKKSHAKTTKHSGIT